MANTANLAPRFTRENAAQMAQRATASRVARQEREKAEERQRDIEARALALSRDAKPEPDDARRAKVLREIDDYLNDMKGAELDEKLKIGKAIADLWKLVQSTPGAAKPSRRASAPPLAVPVTPQADV